MDPPPDGQRGAARLIALALACARPAPETAPSPPAPVVVAEPASAPTEGGRYRVRIERGGPGERILVVHTPDGGPVTDAEVAMVIDGDAMLVVPGDHAGGRYLTREPPGWAPGSDASGEVRVAVDAGAGLDRAVLPLPPEQ